MDPEVTDDIDFRRARELTLSLIEGLLSPAETEELERLVLDRTEIRRYYIRMMHVHAGLHQHASVLAPPNVRIDDDVSPAMLDSNDAMVVRAIREPETDQEPLLTAPPSPVAATARPVAPWWKGRIEWWQIGSIAAIVAICVGVGFTLMRTQSVGTAPISATPTVAQSDSPASVTATANTVWALTDISYDAGDPLAKGKHLDLESGIVQIALAGGGQIICEGPAEFTVDSPQHISLDSGKLVAWVKGGGLVVQTPAMTITDLGTEFGVHVSPNGTTDVAVFQGSVRTAVVNSRAAPQVFKVGQGVTCTLGAAPIPVPAASLANQFKRALPPRITLDLVDIVAGGKGTAHHRGLGIDPTDGHTVSPDDFPGSPRSGGQFHKFPPGSMLDSCFVTPANGQPTPIDSRGDLFAFADSDSVLQAPIWAGGALPPNPHGAIDPALGSIDYSAAAHAMLMVHANSAITFNLDAIRATHQGSKRFDFVAEIGKPWQTDSNGADRSSTIRGYVLVDGIPQFDKNCSPIQYVPFHAKIPIAGTAHFLTLAATASSSGPGDALLVGDPVLKGK
jgi:hypothetical protein